MIFSEAEVAVCVMLCCIAHCASLIWGELSGISSVKMSSSEHSEL